jgi:hypothetical protein
MARNVTAVYRTHETAELVRRELEELGISRGYIHVLPDDARSSSTTTASGTTEETHEGVPHSSVMGAVDDLHLPEDDTRTYKHCLHKGDHVVSVEADDAQIARVQEIMRRPEQEAYNLDTRDEEFRGAETFPRREGYVSDETRLGRRDPAIVDPYTRSYERRSRLDERAYR